MTEHMEDCAHFSPGKVNVCRAAGPGFGPVECPCSKWQESDKAKVRRLETTLVAEQKRADMLAESLALAQQRAEEAEAALEAVTRERDEALARLKALDAKEGT